MNIHASEAYPIVLNISRIYVLHWTTPSPTPSVPNVLMTYCILFLILACGHSERPEVLYKTQIPDPFEVVLALLRWKF